MSIEGSTMVLEGGYKYILPDKISSFFNPATLSNCFVYVTPQYSKRVYEMFKAAEFKGLSKYKAHWVSDNVSLNFIKVTQW